VEKVKHLGVGERGGGVPGRPSDHTSSVFCSRQEQLQFAPHQPLRVVHVEDGAASESPNAIRKKRIF